MTPQERKNFESIRDNVHSEPMTQVEAMKLALETLEEINKLSIGEHAICLPAEIDTAMDTLRQAIEQKQEPVAVVAEVHMSRYTIEWTNGPLPEGTQLYTSPPQRQPLTDEELKPICDEYRILFGHWAHDFARAIEQAHGIKGEA